MRREPDEEDPEVAGTAGHGETLPYSAVPCPACGAVSDEPLTCRECGASLRRSLVRAPGSVLGSYRLIDVIGEGGMGVVYVAEHMRLGRKVAIKTLRSEYSNNALAVRRFFSEARAVNRICHQNIVEITDFVEHPGADNYYIMELLQGTTLARVIDHAGVIPIPVERSVAIMVQVATALQAVHAAGIIHRDLKPDNVFLIERGANRDFVKVLDFGVAKLIETPEQVSVHQTAAGQILGTPEYMSPEQASAKPVTTQTDVYSFGVLLYELVTGRRPVTGKSFGEIVVKHLTAAPLPTRKVKGLPHEVPVELDDLILACLAKEPGDRPDGMGAVVERLEAIAAAYDWPLPTAVDASRTTGGRTSTMPRLHKPDHAVRRRRIGIAVGAVAAVAIAVAAVAVAVGGGDDRAAPPARPESIEIELVTTPPGAEVARAGVVLGRTPLRFETEASARTETFELRLAGYEPATREVQLDRRSRLDVALVPVAAAVPASTPAIAPPPPAAAAVAPAASPATRRDHGRGGAAKGRGAKPSTGSGSAAATTPTHPTPSATPPPDRSGVLDPFAPN